MRRRGSAALGALGLLGSLLAACSSSGPETPPTGDLMAVTAVSRNDVWAVGDTPGGTPDTQHALIEHWAGTGWSPVGCPHPDGSTLVSLTAVSAEDVWAVGSLGQSSLIEHWDGTRWRQVVSPVRRHAGIGQGDDTSALSAVSAVSETDVWAVGATDVGDSIGGLVSPAVIDHWDGVRWTTVESPRLAASSYLDGVAAVSSDDVWAVGNVARVDGEGSASLIEHWDGTRWTRVASPSTTGGSSFLTGVAAISRTDVWAVGASRGFGFGPTDDTLVEHWDGSSWEIVSSPRPAPYGGGLAAVGAVSPNDVWAAGFVTVTDGSGTGTTDGGGSTFGTLIEHWNGAQWSRVVSPQPGKGDSGLSGLTALSGTDAWAVGESGASNTLEATVIQHWDGTSW